jgi:hypothetical protein
LIKDELIRNRIDAKEATLILSGKDFIVRTFEMPPLPHQELYTAVYFEAKKYIPFKIDDLVCDFQYKFDKSSRRNYILFVGIKKENFDKYFSILEKAGLAVTAVEYSAFSVLRLLKLNKAKEKGVIAVINVDFADEDETNLVVLEDGFPLFTRDITSIVGRKGEISEPNAGPGEPTGPLGEIKEDMGEPIESLLAAQNIQAGAFLEKLKREVLVSLHYYDRKFVGKNTNKIFLIINPDYQADLLEVFKDIGLGIQFIDIRKHLRQAMPFSLAFIKAYSGSLAIINRELKINLLSAKKRAIKLAEAPSLKPPLGNYLLQLFKANAKLMAACFLICLVVFLYRAYRLLPLNKELMRIIGVRPQVSLVNPQANYEELTNLFSEYKERINTLDNLIKKQLRFTEVLDLVPRIIPEGAWLYNLYFNNQMEDSRIELKLEGRAYLGDSNKEIQLVNKFLSDLKQASLFTKYFKEINIVSLDRNPIGTDNITSFVISCTNYKGTAN